MTDPGQPAPSPADPPSHAGFTDEMRVDWLAADELAPALPGRLGLTFLPGKRGPSWRYPGHTYQRDAAADLRELLAQGVRRLVLLVEDSELERWSDPGIVELGQQIGVAVDRYPIPDGTAPSMEVMDRILASVRAGRGTADVAVACMGGVGRTGTVAACALVDAGLDARAAIERVRQVRHPYAVETSEQQELVEQHARRRLESPTT